MKYKEFSECILTIKVTNEDIGNIVDKALNEGSLHWCYDSRSKHNQTTATKGVIENGGKLLLYGMNDGVYELTKDKLIIGIQQTLPYLTYGINIDLSSIDSHSADMIVQMALFNELVFD